MIHVSGWPVLRMRTEGIKALEILSRNRVKGSNLYPILAQRMKIERDLPSDDVRPRNGAIPFLLDVDGRPSLGHRHHALARVGDLKRIPLRALTFDSLRKAARPIPQREAGLSAQPIRRKTPNTCFGVVA